MIPSDVHRLGGCPARPDRPHGILVVFAQRGHHGQYRFSTCDLTGCDTRLHLYDYCDMAVFETASEAFITMSDDDCGLQSQVTPVLVSGHTVYIHVEGDGDCNGGAAGVPFVAEYLGGIPGCMDIEACNYLPIATTPDTCYLSGDPECPNIGPDLIINDPGHAAPLRPRRTAPTAA